MQCLSGLIAFTRVRIITGLQARKAHAVLSSLACGQHSQIHNLLGACEPLFKLCFLKFNDKILKNLNFMFYPHNQISLNTALQFLFQLKIL